MIFTIKGMISGEGTMRYTTSAVYTGKWRRNKMHGLGKYLYANGEFYDGEW